jgi:hypothetical protein
MAVGTFALIVDCLLPKHDRDHTFLCFNIMHFGEAALFGAFVPPAPMNPEAMKKLTINH